MIRWGAIIAVAVAAVAGPGAANTPAEAAAEAAQALTRAGAALEAADQAQDRVAALTQTVQAYEQGLAALRLGVRRATVGSQTLQQDLERRSDEIAALLGALQAMGRAPEPSLLLHPMGPVASARAGGILAELTPALQDEAAELRATLEDLELLRQVQQNAAEDLARGLQGAQQARTALSKAMSERRALPRKFAEDRIKTAILLSSADTLDTFAQGLPLIVDGAEQADLSGPALGALPVPVSGTLLRRFNEADAAGVRRPGVIMATWPQAVVTSPFSATIRYQGPLLSYGLVVILEPAPGQLLVLAGLGAVFGQIGEILPQGSPVGLMPGNASDGDDILIISADGAGTDRPETLYIETRENGEPVDPVGWFALKEE